MQLFLTINANISEFDLTEHLLKLGIQFKDIHMTTITFDQYMRGVHERNLYVSDNDPQFTYSAEQIESNKSHFVDCWLFGLSPYKALLFLADKT